MIDLSASFTIKQGLLDLVVEPRKVGKDWVYILRAKGQMSFVPLVITRATGEDRARFWTSIPEGRQAEADQVGPLITRHYEQLQKTENQSPAPELFPKTAF